MEVNTMDAILAQNKAMAQQLITLNKKMEKLEIATIGSQADTTSTCGLCGGPHENHQCYLVKEDQPMEHVNYMGNQRRQPFHDPNANTPPFQPPQPGLPNLQPKPPQYNSFEAALEKLTLKTSEFVQTTNNFIEEQLLTPLPNAFPSDTQVNPKGEYKAITLRSGKALEDVGNKVNVQPTMEKGKEDATKETKIQQPQHVHKATEKSAKKEENIPSLNNYGRR
ncbi:hypothetical protein PIB30_071061 [Stylosanthes scabra]|uniref:Reverse transcriptase domain-containing protein n=1 Tax=Stylosanthes scabra TaxID=79078 RepID=A0ABU6ZMI3_9FABA|nr:hypothetical protein [Stylosanthes scabra]